MSEPATTLETTVEVRQLLVAALRDTATSKLSHSAATALAALAGQVLGLLHLEAELKKPFRIPGQMPPPPPQRGD